MIWPKSHSGGRRRRIWVKTSKILSPKLFSGHHFFPDRNCSRAIFAIDVSYNTSDPKNPNVLCTYVWRRSQVHGSDHTDKVGLLKLRC